ncbi:MAG: glycerate kinase, partial [Halothiobacillus sp. 13-55-253]
RVDFSQLDARLGQIKLICLTDVDNPLTGPTGASAVFGPQKGLAATDIAAMDARLGQIAKRIEAARLLHCARNASGMGAAGGLGFALGAVLGEGALDMQTAQGKVVAEVILRAQRFDKPVICIAGSVHITPAQIEALGLWAAWPLCGDNVDIHAAIAGAAALITERTAEATAAWLGASSKPG